MVLFCTPPVLPPAAPAGWRQSPQRQLWWLLIAVGLLMPLVAPPASAGEFSDEFDRQRFKDGLAHEIAFREAALHVAWGAEPLCDDTTEIEPLVLWSVRSMLKPLSAHEQGDRKSVV